MRALLILLIFFNNFLLSAQLSFDNEIQSVVIESLLLKKVKKIKKTKVISILDSTVSIKNHSWVFSDFESHIFSKPLNKLLFSKSKKAVKELVSSSTSKKNRHYVH